MINTINKQEALESIIEENLFTQPFMVELVGEEPEYDFDHDTRPDTDDARNPIMKEQILVDVKAGTGAISEIAKKYDFYAKAIKGWAKKYDADYYFDSILTTDNSITFVFDSPVQEDMWQPELYMGNEEEIAAKGKKIDDVIIIGDKVKILDPKAPLKTGTVIGFLGEGKGKHAEVSLDGETAIIKMSHLRKSSQFDYDKLAKSNVWDLFPEDIRTIEEEGSFESGHWVLSKINDNEYEAVRDGLYMEVFKNLNDLMTRKNKTADYEYDETKSEENGEETFVDSKGKERLYKAANGKKIEAGVDEVINEAYLIFNASINNGGTLDYGEKRYGYLNDLLDSIEIGYKHSEPDGDEQEALSEQGLEMTAQEVIDAVKHELDAIKDIVGEDKFNEVLSQKAADGKEIYEGKTKEQVWNNWTEAQRIHFIKDHDKNNLYNAEEEALLDYDDIHDTALSDWIGEHMSMGSYGDGGPINESDLSTLKKGFSIKWFREYLNKNFRDSFGFTVNKPKKGTQAEQLIADDEFRGIKDDSLILTFPSNRGMCFNTYQGSENTYFNFVLYDKDSNGYVGGFGFKDDGDVDPEYITRFVALLMQAYGYPFTVKHTVAANGSTIRADKSSLLKYVNFEDNWHINLLKLNPNRNQNGLKYKNNKYAVSRTSDKGKRKVYEFETLEKAENKFNDLVAESKTFSNIIKEGVTLNYNDVSSKDNFHLYAIDQNNHIYTGTSYHSIISNQSPNFFNRDEMTKGYVDKNGDFFDSETDDMYEHGGYVEQGRTDGDKSYTRSQAIKRIKSLLKDDTDILNGRSLSEISDDDIIEIGFNHYGFDYNQAAAANGSVIRADKSSLLKYVNFEDNWHINLLELNPNRNQNGLKYKNNNKYAVSRTSDKGKRNVYEFETLEKAENKFNDLVTESKTFSNVEKEGTTSNYNSVAANGKSIGDIYIDEISNMTGLRKEAVEKYKKDNSLTDNHMSSIMEGLGRKQLNAIDVVTAMSGDKGNEYSESVIEFAKSGKAFSLKNEISSYKKQLTEALEKKYNVNISDTGFDDTHIKLAMDKNESIDDVVSFIGNTYKLTAINQPSSSSSGKKSYICVIKDKAGNELGSYPVTHTDDKYLDDFLKAIGVKMRASDTRKIEQVEEIEED